MSDGFVVRFPLVSDALLEVFVAAGIPAKRIVRDVANPVSITCNAEMVFPVGTHVEHQIGGTFGPSRWTLPNGTVVHRSYDYPPRIEARP